MPTVSDYGGKNYGRRAWRTKFDKDRMRSFRCNGCGKLFYLSHRAATRNVPRCNACGASGEETEKSIKRRLWVTKKQLANKLNTVEAEFEENKPYECRGCYKRFRSAAGLKLHIRDNHPDLADEF